MRLCSACKNFIHVNRIYTTRAPHHRQGVEPVTGLIRCEHWLLSREPGNLWRSRGSGSHNYPWAGIGWGGVGCGGWFACDGICRSGLPKGGIYEIIGEGAPPIRYSTRSESGAFGSRYLPCRSRICHTCPSLIEIEENLSCIDQFQS